LPYGQRGLKTRWPSRSAPPHTQTANSATQIFAPRNIVSILVLHLLQNRNLKNPIFIYLDFLHIPSEIIVIFAIDIMASCGILPNIYERYGKVGV
jgi:hypothetical protein